LPFNKEYDPILKGLPVAINIYSRERIEYGLAPVHSYGGQCEHTHRDGKDMYEWTEGAHERRQIPSL